MYQDFSDRTHNIHMSSRAQTPTNESEALMRLLPQAVLVLSRIAVTGRSSRLCSAVICGAHRSYLWAVGCATPPHRRFDMFPAQPKRGEEDWETEPLLFDGTKDAEDTEAARFPTKPCPRFARWKKVIKLGGLLTFGIALFITPLILIHRYFLLSFEHFGPPEPHNDIVSVRPGFGFGGTAVERFCRGIDTFIAVA